jgi:hypothetical protein
MTKLKLILSIFFIITIAIPTLHVHALTSTTGTAIIFDSLSKSDAIVYSIENAVAPDSGKELVGWLVSDDATTNKSTGVMTVSDSGAVAHTFDQSSTGYTGNNLLNSFASIVITQETIGSNPTTPSSKIVHSYSIPSGSLSHIRKLTTDFTSLTSQIDIAITEANKASSASSLAAGNQVLEKVVNAIEGPNGSKYGDIDTNGTTESVGDGTGLLVHLSVATSAAAVSGAEGNTTVITHSKLVDTNTAHAISLLGQARDEAIALNSETDLKIYKLNAARIAVLLQNARDGIDSDASGTIDSTSSEGAVQQAYVETQKMATFNLTSAATPVSPVPVEAPSVGDPLVPVSIKLVLVFAALFLALGTGSFLARKRNLS